MIELRIPFAAPTLNKWYAGGHWTQRKKVADLWHEAIWVICKEKKFKPFTDPVSITTQTLFKNKRLRDVSNMCTANKLAEDGLVKAGILQGDDPRYVRRHVIECPIFGTGKDETIVWVKRR